MQKLLREGGQDLDIQDGCVPMQARPKIGFFLVPVRSQTRFPSVRVRFGPQAVWDGTGTLVGVPSGPPDPSPALPAQGWEDGAALGGAPRPSAVRRNALINAGASLHSQDKKRWAFWGGRHGRLVRSRWASAAAGAAVARRSMPLHSAAVNGHADATAALLGAGADASIKGTCEYAALHHRAAPHGRPPPAAAAMPAG